MVYIIEPGDNPFEEGAQDAESTLNKLHAAQYPCDMGAAGINDSIVEVTHFEDEPEAIQHARLSAEELLHEFEAQVEWMRGYLSKFE